MSLTSRKLKVRIRARRDNERALALAEANLYSANSILRSRERVERAATMRIRAKLLREIARRQKVRAKASEYVKSRLAEIELL
jgi:hypothetical protein